MASKFNNLLKLMLDLIHLICKLINIWKILNSKTLELQITVDNPVVIFTADAPFRYVGCSGPQNEDDY